jgi:hypothetical protein
MKYIEAHPAWKTFEKWIKRLVLVLCLPALACFVYLAVLESRSANYYDSSRDLPDRIIQGMMCPSLMVKNQPSYVDIMLHNTNPEIEPTATVTIDAPNFRFVREETTVIEEGLSSNWFTSPGWVVIPNQTGKQRITISATKDIGISNAAICEVTVIAFLGLDLEKMYSFSMLIWGSGLVLSVRWLSEKLKKKLSSKRGAG